MDTVGASRHRHIDAVIDDEGHCKRRQGPFDRPRLFDQRARLGALVAQLDQGRAAAGTTRRQIGEGMSARALGIDDGIKTKVEPHQDALTRARSVARSSR
jgi:hypothetical protein